MAQESNAERPVFLSTLPPGPGEQRLALIVVLASVAIFLVLAPFAKVQLPKIWGFIPAYQSALVINDLITAVLLFGQYRILRSRSLLVLASGYLFTAFITLVHTLTFPGLFAETGLLGAGRQSTAWLYMFWHGLFPLFVIGYAFLKDDSGAPLQRSGRARGAILSSVAAVVAIVSGIALLATAGHDLLPAIMQDNRYTPAMIFVVSSVWALSLLALLLLWRRKPHAVLDLWLMVVMCAWVFDIALAAVLNHGRFDLGFYAGRTYGLLAASFVLLILLLEYGRLYARLVDAHQGERQKAEALTDANQELESFSYSVSHDLGAPLRAMDGYAGILEEDYGSKLDDEGRRVLGLVRSNAKRMGLLIDALLAFSRLGRQPVRQQRVPFDDLARTTIDELRVANPGRKIDFVVGELGGVEGDPTLLKQVLVNLLSNAVKYSRDKNPARVELGCRNGEGGSRIYYVKDNGAGFDMRYADKLFGVFQRLHDAGEYEGTGVGLAIVQRVIHRHGGQVWAEAVPGEGATFYFMLKSAP
jgi:signal transduction histidine kinase